MGNRHSRTKFKGLRSPQRYGSSGVVNGYNQGNYSGNTGSGNTYNSGNTVNYNYYRRAGNDMSRNDPEILQCLYTSKYEEHRDRVRVPVEGTCTWVTEHSKYKDWLGKKTFGLLWLSADPGCGKSVAASFLINHLRIHTDAIICYFFFKDDSEEQKSAAFALSAILHQLFVQRNSLTVFAQEAFKAKGKGFTEEVNTLWDIFVREITEGECGEVICVVDALDECGERTLDQLTRCIVGLPRSQTPGIPLKFLVTGRPYLKIERELDSSVATIRLRGEAEINAITADVNRVIDEGIKSLESCWGRVGKLEYLRSLLKSSADRTFLWVSLVLEILKESADDSVEEFTNIVSTAPHDIAEFYTKILDRSRYPDKARKILNIVVAAARPLTLGEMNVAFRIKKGHRSAKDLGDLPDNFDKSVKNWCGLFVRVVDSKIYLVHQTAREFLIKESSLGQGNWQYTICSDDSNFLLADICISYLSLEDFENDPLVINGDYGSRVQTDRNYVCCLRKYPLLDYAATHWADHFRNSQSRNMELFEFTRLICEGGSKRFLIWLKVHWVNNHPYFKFPDAFTHLMIASWFGQGMVVERLLQEGVDIDARSVEYGTALNVAAIRKEEEVAGMLVERSANAFLYGKWYNILNVKRTLRLDD